MLTRLVKKGLVKKIPSERIRKGNEKPVSHEHIIEP